MNVFWELLCAGPPEQNVNLLFILHSCEHVYKSGFRIQKGAFAMRYRISNHFPPLLRVLLGTLLGMCVSTASLADQDHDRARKALEAGEVLPLRAILERVERDHPGQVIDVDLEKEHKGEIQRWIYEIKLVRPGGALVKLKINARDGSLLSEKTRQPTLKPGDRH